MGENNDNSILKRRNFMKREAFKMFLKPGFEKEYEKRHAAIWPELKKMLSDSKQQAPTADLPMKTIQA